MDILPPFCDCPDGAHHLWHFQPWGGWRVSCEVVDRHGFYVETAEGWQWMPTEPEELLTA